MSNNNGRFAENLFKLLQLVNPGVANMEFFEFGYALENLTPDKGWDSIILPQIEEIERMVNSREFYDSIQLKPKLGDHLILDPVITMLNQQLFKGLVNGNYAVEWVVKHFFFDIRGFYFIHRTEYYDEKFLNYMGGESFANFEQKQNRFSLTQSVGYKAFKEANTEVDLCLIDLVKRLVKIKGTPIIVAIAGQTAAGKTEIVERLQDSLHHLGKSITTIEIDNFLTDRDEREAKGIDSIGKEALHFKLFQDCLKKIGKGSSVLIPQYDFVLATSSHFSNGQIKPGHDCLAIKPADIIFIEGNFPFLYPEIAQLIDIKIMYLTGDAVRLQRKWKRDMDYRKKYDLMYFLNRYFREQYIMAESVYKPQMKLCDILVDTTGAEIWVTPIIQIVLSSHKNI